MVRKKMSLKIVITTPVNDSTLTELKSFGEVIMNKNTAPWTRDELLAHCREADALMVFMTDRIDADFLDQCPRLKIIAGALKGYNNIDLQACSERSVLLTNVPDLLTEPTAELTIGMMIALVRNFVPGERHIRNGEFKGWRPQYYGHSINGATIGVIGAGAVGQATMRMLNGFDCRKLYYDKHKLPREMEQKLNASQADIKQIQQTADFIVLAIHLMDTTYHLVNGDFISGMKPGSFLINPARGSLVDENAVVTALTSGQLAGYAADTFEMEDWTIPDRPRTIHPELIASDKTILIPHLGSAVISVRQAIEQSAAESIIAVCKGQIPATAVNAQDIS